MKRLVFIFLFLFSLVNAQESLLGILPMSSSKVSFKQVQEATGMPKEDCINNAKEWFLQHRVTHIKERKLDEKHGSISGKLSFKTLWGPNDFAELYKEVQFDIQVIARNDRYQYEFTNFIVKDPGKTTQLEIYKTDQKKYDSYNRDFYQRIDENIKLMIDSLLRQINGVKEISP